MIRSNVIIKKVKSMGNSGKKFVEENFSWEIIAKKFTDDVQELIK